MGELIRNIKEIQLGNENLMIELNEGYTKREGKLIHIQNKKFRYLLKEKDFMELATTIIRAKEEMDYYKESQASMIEQITDAPVEVFDVPVDEAVTHCVSFMDNAKVDYRLIETGNGFVTFIVQNNDYTKFKKALKKDGKLKKKPHLYGVEMGYKFLYQMRPFELYVYKDVFIEFCFQLPCMSMTPMMWIPLDKCLQLRTWNETDKNANGVKCLDDISYYIYRLGWSVFKKQHFSKNDRSILTAKRHVLEETAFYDCMKMVFFGYTPVMIDKLKQEDYDSIIPDYYRFREY